MATTPLSTIFHGDVTIEVGSSTALYGFGLLDVANNVTVNGTDNGIFGGGSIFTYGGLSITKDTYKAGKNTVMSTSNLQTTNIDTTLGTFTVTGGNLVNISVGSTITVDGGSFTSIVSGGSLLQSSTDTTTIKGGLNSYPAVDIIATDAAGGIRILTGTGATGKLDIATGAGGIQAMTSAGSLNLTANNGVGTFTVNSSSNNQNLTLSVTGATDSGVKIQSSGTNAAVPAVWINTTNADGDIYITNNSTGNAATGQINVYSGQSGVNVTSNTSGPIVILARDAASSFTVDGVTTGADLTLGITGDSDSKVIVKSSGTNATQAVLITTTNASGGIYITNFSGGSTAGVKIGTGSGGLTGSTANGGGINFTANGATSSFINQTTGDNQNLTIGINNSTGSKLILSSDGTGVSGGILITTTYTNGSTAPIEISAQGKVSIQSFNSTFGVNIGTNNVIPINIGAATSVTTIFGDLDVRGVTSTFESTVVLITDNIIQVNSAPGGLSDGGLTVKRYQAANNTSLGAVVADTPTITANVSSVGNTATTFGLAPSDSSVSTFNYTGWWVKITGVTGTGQVRRIKSNTAAPNVVVTIYDTADQTGILANPVPVEGMDFTTTLDATSIYNLYPCAYISSIWDESLDEWAMTCSPQNSSAGNLNFNEYVDLHINDLTANNINVNTINNLAPDSIVQVTLADNTTPVAFTLPGGLIHSIFIIFASPATLNQRAHAIFVLGRVSVVTSTGQVVRLISAKGNNNEQLDMQWPANALPQLLYRPAHGQGGNTIYNLRILGV